MVFNVYAISQKIVSWKYNRKTHFNIGYFNNKKLATENVFYQTLRKKSVKFSPPFNLQYISFSPDTKNILMSDGRLMKSVKFSSRYDYIFDLSLISPYDIVTIYEIERIGRFDLFVGKSTSSIRLGNPRSEIPQSSMCRFCKWFHNVNLLL